MKRLSLKKRLDAGRQRNRAHARAHTARRCVICKRELPKSPLVGVVTLEKYCSFDCFLDGQV
jgi:hypothetical protein